MQNKTFYKYLLSYVIILLIPLIIIVFISYNFFIKAYRQEVLNSNKDSVSKVLKSFEYMKKQVDNIAQQIDTMNEFNINVANSANAADWMEVRRKLLNYRVTSGFSEDIYFYVRNTELLFGSASIYNMKLFKESTYNYKNWSLDQIHKDLNSFNYPVFRPMEEVSNSSGLISKYVTCIYPVYFFNGKPQADVIFQIKEDVFDSMVANAVPGYKGTTLIADGKGSILYSHGDEKEVLPQILEKVFSKQDKNGSQSMKIDRKKYLVSYSFTADNSWLAINVLPEAYALKNVFDITGIFVIGIILILILGLIAIVYFMRLNYNPLKGFFDIARKNIGVSAGYTGDFEAIKHVMERIVEEKKLLDDKLKENKDTLRDLMLMKLMKGEFKTINEFNRYGRELGIALNKKYLQIISILIEDDIDDSFEFTKELNQHFCGQFAENIEAAGFYNNEKKILIYALSYDEISISSLKDILKDIQDFLFTVSKIRVTIGVGGRCEKASNIYMSYMEAFTALDYRHVKGNCEIIFFNEIIPAAGYYRYPKAELEKLEKSMLEGNAGIFDLAIEELLGKLSGSNANLLLARFLCHDVISTIFRVMQDLKKGFIDFEKNYPDVMALMEFHSVDDLIVIVKRICSEVKGHFTLQDSNDAYPAAEKAFKYISENYCSFNFSIQGLAEEIGVSRSSLSQQFKSYSGMTLSDYVDTLRIEKAKQLLAQENMSVKEIILSVGYIDSSSFIRKFKQVSGMTPGEYRKKHK